MQKITNTNIGMFYGLTRQTISKYSKKKTRLYKAMVKYFMEQNLSNCCQAPILETTDLCSKCKEHCEVEKD